MKREDLNGTWAIEREERWPTTRSDELSRQALEFGLESAATIKDRKIPLFNRGRRGYGNFARFMGVPFLQDMRELGGQDVAFMGVPLDTGTTFRSGTRFGPDAMRRISSLGSSYNVSMGVDLIESLEMTDVGDVSVIPANIEKSFDQIALAIGYLHERAVFPVVLGGDHSIGSPFFHATNIENAPATNLVQIGIGGWTGSREGLKNARERQATVITLEDVDKFGIDKVAEYALEIAWHNAKAVFMSFDIDSVDPAFAPGTGTPEPGGFLPRELLKLLRIVAREGLSGMEVVEVSPPYDVADITALLGVRAVMEVLGTLVVSGKLGRMPKEVVEPAVSAAPADGEED
jgi:arginase family enzyme